MKSLLKIIKRMLSTSKAIRYFCLLAFVLGNLIPQLSLEAKKENNHITNLKATFIVNTLNYIRWHDKDFPAKHTHMEFLVVGNDQNKIATRLKYLLDATEFKIKNCQLRVRQVPSLKEAQGQIGVDGKKVVLLLDSELSAWKKQNYPNILGTLIMGESSKYLRKGLVLTFREENNRLKLGVNLKKADAMNLQISSKLLDLNRVVIEESVH
jgi:hypothetical protein